MIELDNRIGSGDLTTYFSRWKVPHKLCRLDYGDAAFQGKGKDSPLYIGVEIKKVRDALNCMTDGRFAGHQLPGLIQKFDKVWLVVEGQYSANSEGMLTEWRGRVQKPISLGSRQFMYRELSNWLTTMETCGGVKVRRTGSRQETAQFIKCLYYWWTVKEFSEHRSHLAMHDDAPDAAILFKPTVLRRIAAQLPGIGWQKSGAIAKHFDNAFDMMCATEKDWLKIPGIGKELVRKIRVALVEGENE